MNDQRLSESPVSPAEENFRVGRVVVTKAAQGAVDQDNDCIDYYVASHMIGDWGMVDDEQWEVNNAAVVAGHGEVRSLSTTSTGAWIEVVTNADWSQTVVRREGEA